MENSVHRKPDECPCGASGAETGVLDTRKASVKGIGTLRRRRVCHICGCRWTTYETRFPITVQPVASAKAQLLASMSELVESYRVSLK